MPTMVGIRARRLRARQGIGMLGEALIRAVPLDKRFAAKLPKEIRAEFKGIVNAVRAADRANSDGPRF